MSERRYSRAVIVCVHASHLAADPGLRNAVMECAPERMAVFFVSPSELDAAVTEVKDHQAKFGILFLSDFNPESPILAFRGPDGDGVLLGSASKLGVEGRIGSTTLRRDLIVAESAIVERRYEPVAFAMRVICGSTGRVADVFGKPFPRLWAA